MRKRRQKLLIRRHAPQAIFVDLEGRAVEGEDPVLLGVLFAEGGGWAERRFVFDERCAAVERKAQTGVEEATVADALTWLIDISDEQGRHIVSWSTYDRLVIARLSGRSFRYRNAIPLAKRWRRASPGLGSGFDDGAGNSLAQYERVIGCARPPERHAIGAGIDYIRRHPDSRGSVERWKSIVQHNRHDLHAMRAVVVFKSLGIGDD